MFKRSLCAAKIVQLMFFFGCGTSSAEGTSGLSDRQLPRQTSAVSTAVSVIETAEQFLDLVEQTIPELFSPEQPTSTLQDFRFRHYPSAGTFVGVVTSSNLSKGYHSGDVYAMGGPLGNLPRFIGQAGSFLTPVDPRMKTAPELAATFVDGLSHSPRGAGQPCSNRTAWAGANARTASLTQAADVLLTQSFPAWDQTAYINAATSGNPDPGESMVTARIRWLYPLVIAECANWNGKYLSRIDEVLKGLASQPTWTSPIADRQMTALNGSLYVIDLVSATTAQDVAQTLYLLGDKVPVGTRNQIMSALKARVLNPARAAVNEGTNDWFLHTNINWNAVLVGGTVGAALAALPSRYERAWFASFGQRYIQSYIAGFPVSGFSTEGPSYWIYGTTHMAMLRQNLYVASAGIVDLFDTAKVQAISLYGNRFTMTPYGGVAPIGDSFASTYMDYAVRQMMAAAYGSRSSGWPQAAQLVNHPQNGNDAPISWASMILSGTTIPVVSTYRTTDFETPGLRSYFEDAGVLVSRSALSDTVPMAITVKAAGSINHAHDDLGSYTIGVKGSIVTGDIGRGSYTSRTFSDQRRTVKWINSYGHPVPVIGGRLQLDGLNAANLVSTTSFTDTIDDIVINLAPAYGLPHGATLERTARNDRIAGSMFVKDEFKVPTAETFEVPVTTVGSWTQLTATEFVVSNGGESVRVVVEASAPVTILGESITDDGLTFQRVAIRLVTPATTGWVKTTFFKRSTP